MGKIGIPKKERNIPTHKKNCELFLEASKIYDLTKLFEQQITCFEHMVSNTRAVKLNWTGHASKIKPLEIFHEILCLDSAVGSTFAEEWEGSG